MEDNKKYGMLLNDGAKLHRQYFREMVKLLGINVLYRIPLPDKHYTNYTELDSSFEPPMQIGCIFDEHPTQQTLKKMGWVSELGSDSSIIHVDYDLRGLQQGALFIIPSGLDNAKGRLFKVVKLTNIMVYPASIACEIVPEYINTIDPVTLNDFSHSDFNVINEEPDSEQFLGAKEHMKRLLVTEEYL